MRRKRSTWNIVGRLLSMGVSKYQVLIVKCPLFRHTAAAITVVGSPGKAP